MIRVVFLHGFMGEPTAWAPITERIGELHPGVDLVTPWLPGHGRAAEPVAGTDFGAAIDALVSRLSPGPSVWVGYSMGARIALGVAARHPSLVGGLALVSSHLGLISEADRARRAAEDEAFARLADRGIEEMAAAHEARPVLAAQANLPACLRQTLHARRREHEPLAIASAIRALGLGAMPDLRSSLRGLDAPVVAIAGAGDPTYADLAREAAALTRGEVVIVPGAGHDVVLEDPEQVTSAVRRTLARIDDGTRRPPRVTESHP